MDGKIGSSLKIKYHYLDSLLTPELKQPVLTLFLESDIAKMNPPEELEAVAREIFNDNENIYKKYIDKLMSDRATFKKGTPAPGFVLENEKAEKISLELFRGKVLYLDFWYAACGPCHALFELTATVKKMYAADSNVVFLNISIDPADTWKESITKFKIAGYHAFTENKRGDHPIISAYKVTSYPTTCIIDKKGNIFSASMHRNAAELKQIIEAALQQ
jgi:cytochrome oxidase Cu insertion factor (SCO1/SenC/PrrC family)